MAMEKIEDVMLRYVSNYGRRSSRRDKERFYLYLAELLQKEFDYPVTFCQMGSGWAKVGLAIAGDLSKADNVLIAPLDTPKKTHKPNYRSYPLNDEKAKNQELIAYSVDMLLGLLLAVAAGAVCYLLSKSWIGALAAVWVVWFLYGMLQRNRDNFTKSSASLALMTHMAMEKTQASGRTKTAYVFVDKSSQDRAGVDMFLNRYSDQLSQVRNIIYLDFLANGEELVMASQRQLLPRLKGMEDEVKRGEADKTNFLAAHPEVILLMTADRENEDWCVHDLRTVRDRKIDMKRLKKLEAALMAL